VSIRRGMRNRGRPSDWTPERVAKLRKLYCSGLTYPEIGEELGVNGSTVRCFVRYNLKALGLTPRREKRHNPKTFESEWYGAVPRGHWSICKPWGSKRYYRELREAARDGREVRITW